MKILKVKHIPLLVIIVVFISCNNKKTNTPEPVESVKIGEQVWMVNNLNVDSFQNGDPIEQIKNSEKWLETANNERPGWCYFKNDESTAEIYGRLYNWYAVNDTRGICPKGWHVPSKTEVEELIKILGGQDVAGHKMKSKEGWGSKRKELNSSGFTALPGKSRGANGRFDNSDHLYSNWWLSSKADYGEASAWSMAVDEKLNKLLLYEIHKQTGYHVRCLKD